jgi:hypothetical protein
MYPISGGKKMKPYRVPKKYEQEFKEYCGSKWGHCGTRSDCIDCRKRWVKQQKEKKYVTTR